MATMGFAIVVLPCAVGVVAVGVLGCLTATWSGASHPPENLSRPKNRGGPKGRPFGVSQTQNADSKEKGG
jgi:hypothetical protein